MTGGTARVDDPEYHAALLRLLTDVANDFSRQSDDLNILPSTSAILNQLRRFVFGLHETLIQERFKLWTYISPPQGNLLIKALRDVSPKNFSRHSVSERANRLTSLRHTVDEVLAQILNNLASESNEWSEDDKDDAFSIISNISAQVDFVIGDLISSSLAEIVESASSSAAQIQKVQENVKEASGTIGTESLAIHFDKYATSQTRTMWGLRSAGAATLGIAFFIARAVVFDAEKPLAWDAEVARLALTVPVLFLAYYFLREAAHHRDASQRAKEDSVRLKTVRAYTDEMPDEQKLKLRYELGQRVFTDKAPAIVDADIDAKDATSLLGAITALLGVAKK